MQLQIIKICHILDLMFVRSLCFDSLGYDHIFPKAICHILEKGDMPKIVQQIPSLSSFLLRFCVLFCFFYSFM